MKRFCGRQIDDGTCMLTNRRAAPQPRLSADCDLNYLLTGVFSAPTSGVFERRADPRHRLADLRLVLLLHPGPLVYFTELVFTNIKIPVNEFYIKRHFPEARTIKILCKPNARTKSAVDKRFEIGLSVGREALFVPGC